MDKHSASIPKPPRTGRTLMLDRLVALCCDLLGQIHEEQEDMDVASEPTTPVRPTAAPEPNAPSGKAPHWAQVEQETCELYGENPARVLFPRSHPTQASMYQTPDRPTVASNGIPIPPCLQAMTRNYPPVYQMADSPMVCRPLIQVQTPSRPTQSFSTDAPARPMEPLSVDTELYREIEQKYITELYKQQVEKPYPACVLPPLRPHDYKIIIQERYMVALREKEETRRRQESLFPTAQFPPVRMPVFLRDTDDLVGAYASLVRAISDSGLPINGSPIVRPQASRNLWNWKDDLYGEEKAKRQRHQ